MKPIKIESSVPLTPRGRWQDMAEAMAKMKPGDSFLIPEDCPRQTVYTNARRLNYRVSIRTTKAGDRVWRIGFETVYGQEVP